MGARLRNLLDNMLGLILMAGEISHALVVAPDARKFNRCLPLLILAGRRLVYARGCTICRESILPCLLLHIMQGGHSLVFAISQYTPRGCAARSCLLVGIHFHHARESSD